MRTAISEDAIQCMLDGGFSAMATNQLKTNCYSFTLEGLQNADQKFSSNIAYSSFISSLHAHGKINIVLRNEPLPPLTTLCEKTFCAAVEGGRALIVGDRAVYNADLVPVNQFGLSLFDKSDQSIELANDSSLERHFVVVGVKQDVKRVTKYCQLESSVYAYDRYLNNGAVDLILEVAAVLNSDAKIKIMTTNLGAGNLHALTARLKVLHPKMSISGVIVDHATHTKYHERYLIVKDKYQLHLTYGLDAFGTKNNGWVGNGGAFIVYDLRTEITRQGVYIANGGQAVSKANGKPEVVRLKIVVE